MALPNKVKTLLDEAQILSEYKDCSAYFYKWLSMQFSKQPVRNLINARAEFIDRLLIKLFNDTGLSQHPDLALIAIGGYGRGELHPYSDIDFLVLTQTPPCQQVTARLEEFVTFLWDIGLDIGHSVRTHEQVLEQKQDDVHFTTSLHEIVSSTLPNEEGAALCVGYNRGSYFDNWQFCFLSVGHGLFPMGISYLIGRVVFDLSAFI